MMDEDWPDFQYRLVEVDLSDYIGQSIYVAWHGIGDPYWSFGLDNIHFPGDGTEYFPSMTATLKVVINDTVSGGDAITNTAELTGYHTMGGKYVSEATKKSKAITKIGVSDFSQSFKEAPASISPGGVLTYTIHVMNTGGKTVWVDLADTLPVSTTFKSLVPQPNAMEPYVYDEDTDAVSWSGYVNGGEERIFTFYANADAKLPFGHVITNTATILWEEDGMELVATTKLIPSAYLFIPMTTNNYQPPAP